MMDGAEEGLWRILPGRGSAVLRLGRIWREIRESTVEGESCFAEAKAAGSDECPLGGEALDNLFMSDPNGV
jgi:hypothetical protein